MFKHINWKAFILSFVAQFIISSLLYFGVKAPKALDFLTLPHLKSATESLVNPLPKLPDIIEIIRPKLTLKQNNFHLQETSSIVSTALASSDFDQANAYVVIDFDSGKVLAEKNMSKKMPIASLTKIMTSVVALDLASNDDMFEVSTKAERIQPTKIGVVAGQEMNLEELLNASMLTSANDAVEVIKEGIDQKYNSDIFVRAMNEKAKIIGLNNTHFENPQGFDSDDSNHYSSAEDLSILSHYALTNYPLISEIAKKDYQFIEEDQNHKQFDLYNWNGLLGVYPGVYGLKIGNTEKAGFTTVVVSERPNYAEASLGKAGKKVLVVLLGAPGVLERDLWASELLDRGFEKLGLPKVGVTEGELKAKYNTWKYWG